jgi:dethiobiotin synthetase
VRPQRLVAVVGTGTDIGKTWVSARLLNTLRQAGVTVSARKLAQSFDPGDDPAGFDSAVLGAASGERSEAVCPRHRWYEVAMAPPMAADVLGEGRITTADLLEELIWPTPIVEVGLVETAGGVRSPQTNDGDGVDLVAALAPDVVVLVADAGLGTINAVRLTAGALTAGAMGRGGSGDRVSTVAGDLVVVLNRFDEKSDLHQRNRGWLTEQDSMTVVALPGEEPALATLVRRL